MRLPIKDMNIASVTRRLRNPFVISRGARTHQHLLRVRLSHQGKEGRGEAAGVAYRGETVDTMMAQLTALQHQTDTDISRVDLLKLLPAGGARNALDAALWDLEAKTKGIPAWQIAGLGHAPKPVVTAYTITLNSPEHMAAQAQTAAHRPLLKVKLGGRDGLDPLRVKAVRAGAPAARLVADGNGGLAKSDVGAVVEALEQSAFELLEQPFARGAEAQMDDLSCSLNLCADESFMTDADFPRIAGRFDHVNIKLDKCGGLTAGLALAEQAKSKGYDIFVGTMLTGVMGTAPALLLAQSAKYVDLDGPLLLAEDDPIEIEKTISTLTTPPTEYWG